MSRSSPQVASAHAAASAAVRPAVDGRTSVALFNDTADNPHVGCLAVSQAHRQMLDRAGAIVRHAFFCRDWKHLAASTIDAAVDAALASDDLRDVLGDVDAVVVNGEGTIHHGCGRHLLAILGAAQRLGLPTLLVNAVLQEVDEGRDILAALTDCTVRDACSARYLDALEVPNRLVPDSFFEADFVDVPRHDFSGHLVLTDCHPHRSAQFAPLLAGLHAAWKGMVSDYPLEAPERISDWQHALADVRSAGAIVTGRHHGVCLALRAGVPFVVLPSNTWKIEGLLELLDGYPVEAADPSRPLIDRVLAALEHRTWFARMASRWRDRVPLTTFARLQPGFAAGTSWTTPGRANRRTLDCVRRVARPGGGVLHAGSGRGALVRALLQEGVDAAGVEISNAAIARSGPIASRCTRGTPHALPFPARQFGTVVVDAGWLDHLEDDRLSSAIAEIVRVARDAIVVEVSGRPFRRDTAAGVMRRRSWWEERFFAAGLRRHTRYLDAFVSAEEGDADGPGSVLLLQHGAADGDPERRIPIPGAAAPPDILRRTGAESDAHAARYEWARAWIKPGDVVIDATCGHGEGAALLWDSSEASSITAVAVSEAAADYGTAHFRTGRPGLEFRVKDSRFWDRCPAASVDCVVAFTPPQAPSPGIPLIASALRVLRPGGRLLCSIADLSSLQEDACGGLLLDEVYTEPTEAGGRPVLAALDGSARIDIHDGTPGRWLVSCVKDPLLPAPVAYEERAFPPDGPSTPNAIAFARDYANPWAVHAIVMGSFRVRSRALLGRLAERWLNASPRGSADEGAALCVLAYRELDGSGERIAEWLTRIGGYQSCLAVNPTVRRWQISLRFVEGLLNMRQGDLAAAERSFHACAREDASAFSPHLETKTTEAAWLAGRLALERGDRETADAEWRGAFDILARMKSAPVSEWLVTPRRPAAFEVGDGLREIAIAVDNAARCANGLRHLAGSRAWHPAHGLHRSFQTNTAALLDVVGQRGGAIDALRAARDAERSAFDSAHGRWHASVEALQAENHLLELRVGQLAAERAAFRKRIEQRDSPAAAPLLAGIFGTGSAAMKVWEAMSGLDDVELAWFADNDPMRQRVPILWLDVIAPSTIPSLHVDVIVIGSMSRDPIREQLRRMGVAERRILVPVVSGSVEEIRQQLSVLLRDN